MEQLIYAISEFRSQGNRGALKLPSIQTQLILDCPIDYSVREKSDIRIQFSSVLKI